MEYSGNKNGFSLLEVIIALAIFSIGIVALYTAQTRTIGQNYTSSRITTAITWASEKVEDLISLPYDDVKDTDNDNAAGLNDITTATADGSETSPDGVYTVFWNVATDVPMPRTKTIRIAVVSQRAGTGSQVDLDYIKHEVN